MTSLLFDENLSHKLPAKLADVYPGSAHVRQVGLLGAGDERIWDYAVRNGLVIVSKDDDFRQRSFLRGAPPKVVWLAVGNATTSDVVAVLRAGSAAIERFVADAEASLLVLRRANG
jgi:predicted nuclease of predicted toxin-antitoxin system